jgi:hypothetical protein
MCLNRTGEVALEAAEDLGRAQALGRAALGVGARGWVPAQAPDGEQVQGAVGLAVAAPVEPVADGPARGGRDRGDAAQVGEGGFATQAVGVVARGHQQGGGGVGADALEGDQVRGGRGDQLAQVGVERLDLGGQLPVPDGDHLQGDLGGRGWGARGARPERGGHRDQAGHHRRAAGCMQGPDALDRPSPGLGPGSRGPGQHRPRGRLGVDRVGLAAAPVLGPLGALDLHYGDPLGAQPAAQVSPVAAGPLDSDALHHPEPAGPGQELRVAGRGRGNRVGPQEAADLVQGGADVLVGVRVHPDRDRRQVGSVLRSHRAVLLGACGRGARNRRGRRTVLRRGRSAQARIGSRVPASAASGAPPRPGRQISTKARGRGYFGSDQPGQRPI